MSDKFTAGKAAGKKAEKKFFEGIFNNAASLYIVHACKKTTEILNQHRKTIIAENSAIRNRTLQPNKKIQSHFEKFAVNRLISLFIHLLS